VSRLWRATLLAVGLWACLAAATRLDPLRQGLRAEYYSNATWTPPVAVARVDRRPSAKRFLDYWNGRPPDAFSATWTGSLFAARGGSYEIATESDDGSFVYVDGRLVVDNGGHHPRRRASGTVDLGRGPHTLLILYDQDGGELAFEFSWGRNGAPLTPVPAWALWGRRAGSFARVIPSLVLHGAFESVQLAALALFFVATCATAYTKVRAAMVRDGLWRDMRWILAGSFVLNVAGIWWGLPSTWVAIETVPVYVLAALSMQFAHGWFELYPPMQYYLLSLVSSPILLLHSMDVLSYYTPAGSTVLILSYRLLSIVFGIGTVAAIAFAGRLAFGNRAGVLAAGIAALGATFVYYAKTANVDMPYVFWYSVSLVFLLRLLQQSRVRDYVLFSVTATLALGTKDQAYALYLTVPVIVVIELWRQKRIERVSWPLARVFADRRIVAAVLAAVGTFVVVFNLIFNFDGFVMHVRATTGAAALYGVFDSTLAGHWQLLILTIRLVRDSMGWPFFIAALGGVTVGFLTRADRRTTLWLLAGIPAYYLGLIEIVRYNYDRFMLPICVLLSIFAGFAFDRLLSVSLAGARWRRTLVAAAFAYSFLYAATVDVLMIGDSRYVVGRWMADHIDRNIVVGVMGLREYLPTLEDYHVTDIATVEELRGERPRFFILNADYVQAADSGTDFARLASAVQSGQLGYHLRLRYRRKTPLSLLPWPHPDLVGDRRDAPVFSILRNVNPTIEVYEAQERGPPRGESNDR
jgi:hypothetical protein